MNNARRKALNEVIDMIHEAMDKLQEAYDAVDEVSAEEQDCLDNIPENLQGSERYQMSEEAVDNMDSIKCDIEEYMGNLEDVCTAIEDVVGA